MPDPTTEPVAPSPPPLDPNDILLMEICRQGLRQISECQANKARDFLTFQTAILSGDAAATDFLKPLLPRSDE
jgi:hypothetical protein